MKNKLKKIEQEEIILERLKKKKEELVNKLSEIQGDDYQPYFSKKWIIDKIIKGEI